MTSNTAEIGTRIREDIIVPVAKGTAQGSERLAKGSERLADAARRMADRTRVWADDVTGARTRRRVTRIIVVAGLGVVVAYILFLSRRSED